MFRSFVVALLTVVLCLTGFPAVGRADLFYSVHLASYEKLENANRHVNRLKHRRDVIFWKEIQIPGKGRFYRVYTGRFKHRSDAVAFWNQLKSEGGVSYFGIHAFSETLVGVDVNVPIELPKNAESPKDPVPSMRSQTDHRFLDNRDGTVIDTWTGLMWVKNGWRLDLLSAVDWWQAKKKCEQFRLQGHSDWRLPTVAEWKSLIDPAQQNPALVTSHPFENIIAHMPYWTATDFSSPSGRKPPPGRAVRAYTVLMYYGTLNYQRKKELAFVLPVRSIE